MAIFVMGGAQITGPLAFRRHFEPDGFLRSLRQAAGFAVMQLSCLSAWDRYLSEALYLSAFMDGAGLAGLPEAPEGFLNVRGALFNLSRDERAAVAARGAEPDAAATLEYVWDTAMPAQAGMGERGGREAKRLFIALSAGYLLARRPPAERPISPEAAAAAYLQRRTEAADGRWLELRPGAVELEPRREAYRVLMDARAAEGLAQGAALELCRVVAPRGAALELYPGRFDAAAVRVDIAPGDYRYFTLAGGRPAFMHPLVVKNGFCTMERRGAELYLRMFREEARRVASAEDVASFAPEAGGEGWVAVLGGGQVDMSRYTRSVLPVSRALSAGPAVQAAMSGRALLLLRPDGTVESNLADIYASGQAIIDVGKFDKLGGVR